jgi:hypothetical protein
MASAEVEPGGKAARRIAEIEKAAERGGTWSTAS